MANQTKSTWDAALATYIDDNTSGNITPLDHRTVLDNLSDSVVWRLSTMTITKGLIRPPTVSTNTGLTMSGDVHHYVFNGASTGSWTLPAGVDGQSYRITNRTAFNLTVNPNGTDTILNTDPFIIYPGTTYDAVFVSGGGSINEWVFKG